MAVGKIRIGQGRIVPMEVRMPLTLLLMGLMAYLISQTPEPDLVFMVVFIGSSSALYALWTVRKVLEVDMARSAITYYYWVLGVKASKSTQKGKPVHLELHEKSESFGSKKHDDFQAYLALDQEELLFVISREEAEDLYKIASNISKKLGIPLKDHIPTLQPK